MRSWERAVAKHKNSSAIARIKIAGFLIDMYLLKLLTNQTENLIGDGSDSWSFSGHLAVILRSTLRYAIRARIYSLFPDQGRAGVNAR